MTITSANSNNSLLKQLQSNGLSADKAKLVEKDLKAAETATSVSIGSAATTVTSASVRAALDTKIAADVSSGKLSANDAAAVKKTLDRIDGQSSGSGITSQAATGTVPSSSSGDGSADTASLKSGGGGGGGGGASKTELSETITVAGSTKTTMITYTDNSTATTTTTATDEDKVKYGKLTAAHVTSDVAGSYLSTVEPGSLIDRTA